ncbi:NAD(P)/FAD-dependent oxidoreductase [Ascidiaceihabitans sp.]|uniref:NAD(P)/FAD-dependent oxidoreductase n=1 Tax=Ascidiaceihabitans sp. TaxID=1872644 RepID=UPI00329853E3
MRHDCDIAIVGAGPAGSALACLLASRYSVVIVEKQSQPAPRIGESLIPGARRLLRDMGLLEAIEARGYPAYLGNQSVWGSDQLENTDFIRDPDGPGWHLDRADFERTLRDVAGNRGASVLTSQAVSSCERDAAGWGLGCVSGARIHARIVVDATGRKASIARMIGQRPVVLSKTVAVWMRLPNAPTRPRDKDPLHSGTLHKSLLHKGMSTIASCATGWWYTAPVRDGRVVSLHTDSDLVTENLRRSDGFVEAARQNAVVVAALAQTCANDSAHPRISAANTSLLPVPAGKGWLAVGDAALALDPLSSRGVFQSLYTGLAAAAEIDAALQNKTGMDFAVYAAHLQDIAATYRGHLDLFYRTERRWQDAPFWKRRQG